MSKLAEERSTILVSSIKKHEHHQVEFYLNQDVETTVAEERLTSAHLGAAIIQAAESNNADGLVAVLRHARQLQVPLSVDALVAATRKADKENDAHSLAPELLIVIPSHTADRLLPELSVKTQERYNKLNQIRRQVDESLPAKYGRAIIDAAEKNDEAGVMASLNKVKNRRLSLNEEDLVQAITVGDRHHKASLAPYLLQTISAERAKNLLPYLSKETQDMYHKLQNGIAALVQQRRQEQPQHQR